jgi:uncharacterized membrane protein
MKKISILLLMFFITSCSLLDVESSDVTNNYTTVGQELIDLKKAYDEGALTEGEYNKLRQEILNK